MNMCVYGGDGVGVASFMALESFNFIAMWARRFINTNHFLWLSESLRIYRSDAVLLGCLFVWYRGLFWNLTHLVITFCHLSLYLYSVQWVQFGSLYVHCQLTLSLFLSRMTILYRKVVWQNFVSRSKRAKSEFNLEVKFYSRYIVVHRFSQATDKILQALWRQRNV